MVLLVRVLLGILCLSTSSSFDCHQLGKSNPVLNELPEHFQFKYTMQDSTKTTLKSMSKDSIILGQPPLSFYRISGGIVTKVLERLGYEVKIVEAPHEDIFPKLQSGEIDFLNAIWLPKGHGVYYEKYKDSVALLTQLYEGAGFFAGVTENASFNSLEDLARPEILEQVERKVQGIGAGAGISEMMIAAIQQYSLDEVGYHFEPGTSQQWIAAFENSLNVKDKYAIIPLWHPHFLNERYPIKPLKDPKGIFAQNEKVYLGIRKELINTLDTKALNVLRNIQLDISEIAKMDLALMVQKQPLEVVIEAWLETNRERFNSWFDIKD